MLLDGKTAPMLTPCTPQRVKGQVVVEKGAKLPFPAVLKIVFGLFTCDIQMVIWCSRAGAE